MDSRRAEKYSDEKLMQEIAGGNQIAFTVL